MGKICYFETVNVIGKKIIGGFVMKIKLVLWCTLLGVLLAGCKFAINGKFSKDNNSSCTTTQWANLIDDRPDIAIKFDDVGGQHNEMLVNLYNELVAYKASSTRNAQIHHYLTDGEIKMVIHNFFANNEYRSSEVLGEDVTSQEQYNFSEESQVYICMIDEAVSNEENDLKMVLENIERIERDAETHIPTVDVEAFYSYTATTRASLAYWTEHVAEWENLRSSSFDDDQAARGAIIDWFKKQRKKIAMCAASDAAGAAVGAGVGAALGSVAGGPGAAAGAALGAIIVGAASSAEGWSTGELCIVVPWSKLKDKIK